MRRFIVLDRETRHPLYEAETLQQAQGYVDGHAGLTAIAGLLETCNCHECVYKICCVDTDTGQVVGVVTEVEIFDAVRLFASLRLVLLPECVFRVQPEGGGR